MTEPNSIEAAAYATGGAVAGGVVASTVGGMGLAVGGTAFSIGAVPVVAAGAVVGLAAYGLKASLNNSKVKLNFPDSEKQGINQAISDRLEANLEEAKHKKLLEAQAERDAFWAHRDNKKD